MLCTYTLLSDVTSFQNKNNMEDSEEQRGLISKFVGVSGVSEERAKFFLESASWNLEVGHCLVVVVFVAGCRCYTGGHVLHE